MRCRGWRARDDSRRGADAAAGADPDGRRCADAVRRPQAALQRAITLAALCVVVAVCAALLYLTDRDGTLALHVGGWGPTESGMGPLGITLVVDRLSALMLVVSSIVLLAVVFYAIGQGIRDGDERQPVSIFLPTYLVLSAGVCTRVLGRRPVQPVRRVRGAVVGELRAADDRRQQGSRPARASPT